LDASLLKQLAQLDERKKVKFNRRLATYLLFLLLAAALWLLQALEKPYITTIEYPVRYANLPPQKVLYGNIPDKLTLRVNAQGFTLLRYKISSVLRPIVFDMGTYSLSNTVVGDNSRKYLLTKFIFEKLNEQIGAEVKILAILPDTVYFQFANRVEKRIVVKPKVEMSFEEQYMLRGRITTLPDSMLLSGPDLILDTLKAVYTEKQVFNKLDEPQKLTVAVLPLKYITFQSEEVILSVDVDKYTESGMSLPVEAINVPEGYRLRTFPAFINVSYKVCLSDFKSIQPGQFRVVVDYSDIEENEKRLPVKLLQYPRSISGLKLQASNVEYIVEK
jgi:hypothetical protein